MRVFKMCLIQDDATISPRWSSAWFPTIPTFGYDLGGQGNLLLRLPLLEWDEASTSFPSGPRAIPHGTPRDATLSLATGVTQG